MRVANSFVLATFAWVLGLAWVLCVREYHNKFSANSGGETGEPEIQGSKAQGQCPVSSWGKGKGKQ